MANWKLTLSYDGGRYHGWQVQPGLATVQGALAEALYRVTGEQVLPQGSGRTDAGVHALAQVASVSLRAAVPAANLLRALNHVLARDVRVLTVEEVPSSFHARHSAVAKTYEYRIFERRGGGAEEERTCPPFVAPFAWDCRWALDFDAMQGAAAFVVGTHDFTSLAASDPERGTRADESGAGQANPVKTIFSSAWDRRDGLLVYRVRGSGFLHHMVRNLVGTFVEVGRGALLSEDFQGVLAARNRAAAGPTAPACGLFLVGVEYGEVNE